jgi:hypothetical protein
MEYKLFPHTYNYDEIDLFTVISNDKWLIKLRKDLYKNYKISSQFDSQEPIFFRSSAKVIHLTDCYIQELIHDSKSYGFSLKFEEFIDCLDQFGVDENTKIKWIEIIFDKYRKGWKSYMKKYVYNPSLKTNTKYKFYSHLRLYSKILDIIHSIPHRSSIKSVIIFTASFLFGSFFGFYIR